ncbi:endonuclease [Methanomicrobiaceae archaeon CYW5]|uniref:tRNA-intron lyase n=1 Tax=Methanovulcanius yangii TaxID=1789227 RepID=UPI0029CA5283|nr:tRNA-intron lyase [Methanovulcanius yangii]MBT8508112.1 endonuclease [Methanovulcanius yangii]
MIGKREGTTVVLGKDGTALHEQSGFGRVTRDKLTLAPEEALYLVHRNKIEVKGEDFTSLLAVFSVEHGFMRRFLVYRDMRERGYVIQPGPHDFRVFRRGEKPGKGRSQYMIRVLSERDLVNFTEIAADVGTTGNMRKQYVIAVVDDEDEITYYEVKTDGLKSAGPAISCPPIEAGVFGSAVLTLQREAFPDDAWIGTPLDKTRLLLSPMEALYLQERGLLVFQPDAAAGEEFFRRACAEDPELPEKGATYSHMRDLGYIPRTAYKFGHHFRVYSGGKKHSELLVHAIASGIALPMSVISRSVRLAHSVRKKMLFACVDQKNIEFIEFARIKL